MRVPDEILKAVVFVGINKSASDNTRMYGGTAFVIAYPSINGSSFCYLVTAKHVADQLEGCNFWVRVNTTDGRAVFASGEGARWTRHPDPSVDVAVLQWSYPDLLDIYAIPMKDFLTSKLQHERNIGIGDEVFLPGLFAKVTGESRNIPILRTGTLAMLPFDNKVPTMYGEADVYLIEARSIGGLSGSPVFVRETLMLPIQHRKQNRGAYLHGAGPFYLLGLMHGHWDVKADDFNAVAPQIVGKDGVNLGIAVVVPASKILETLSLPELEKHRKEMEDVVKTGNPQ